MKVISQLDRKFIVCVVDATSESNGDSQTSDCSKRILVLVDQHAASERIRVEGYLKTLCHHFLDAGHEGSQTTFRVKLEPPRPVLLSRREVSMLRSSSQILQRWGFDLSWPESEIRDQNADQEVVLVHSVPQVVGEKVPILSLFLNGTHSFTNSFSWETSCGISLENTQNSLESMMHFQP
jgi:DNA mismatch repair protein MLH3